MSKGGGDKKSGLFLGTTPFLQENKIITNEEIAKIAQVSPATVLKNYKFSIFVVKKSSKTA